MKLFPTGVLLLFITLGIVSCNRTPANSSGEPSASAAKRYHLKGKVVSIDKQAKMANIDGEAIPDFMGAMTMPYEVKPESELDHLTPGETITADVVLENDNYWLENIVVADHTGNKK